MGTNIDFFDFKKLCPLLEFPEIFPILSLFPPLCIKIKPRCLSVGERPPGAMDKETSISVTETSQSRGPKMKIRALTRSRFPRPLLGSHQCVILHNRVLRRSPTGTAAHHPRLTPNSVGQEASPERSTTPPPTPKPALFGPSETTHPAPNNPQRATPRPLSQTADAPERASRAVVPCFHPSRGLETATTL